MKHVDQRIAALSASQRQVFSRAQALAAGLSPSGLSRRVRGGLYVPLGPQTYHLAGAAPPWRGLLLAGVLDLGPRRRRHGSIRSSAPRAGRVRGGPHRAPRASRAAQAARHGHDHVDRFVGPDRPVPRRWPPDHVGDEDDHRARRRRQPTRARQRHRQRAAAGPDRGGVPPSAPGRPRTRRSTGGGSHRGRPSPWPASRAGSSGRSFARSTASGSLGRRCSASTVPTACTSPASTSTSSPSRSSSRSAGGGAT